MSIGFGVVGTGMIAGFHARALGAIPDARLVGAFDAVPERAEKFAQEQGCTAYSDLDAMLANKDIHVVTI